MGCQKARLLQGKLSQVGKVDGDATEVQGEVQQARRRQGWEKKTSNFSSKKLVIEDTFFCLKMPRCDLLF